MLRLLLVLSLIGSTFLACAEAPNFTIKLDAAERSQGVSSGSGMVPHGAGYYVVGDDSAYFFEVDQHFNVLDKTQIKASPLRTSGRAGRKNKPDFEAMAQFVWEGAVWNLIVGSGGKAGVRDYACLISADKSQRYERQLTALYWQFVVAGGMVGKQRLNIEGLAAAGDQLYFFNRGNSARNMIFQVNRQEVIDYMTGKIEQLSQIRQYEIRLPVLSKVEAGLSGADFWEQTNSLIYAASVEAADGAILGSFIGLIPLERLRQGELLDLRDSALLLTHQGLPLQTKVESVAVNKKTQRNLHGALVSDNDDGSSEFINFTLRLSK